MQSIRYSAFLALSATLTTAAASNAYAQAISPSSVPSAARPETVQRQYRFEDRPSVSSTPLITIPEEGNKELKGDVSFELKSIEFEGLTQFTPEELRPLYQSQLGGNIGFAELNVIANKVTAYYRNKGFILTRAVVPPQRIDGGVARIRIVEGYVSDVVLQGDVGSKDSVLYKYADKIKNAKPLDAKTLEYYLLLMEDLPGVHARAVLSPSPNTPGASQVIVTIARKALEDTSLSFDNRGTRFLGPYQLGGTLAGNNQFNMDEQTLVRGINSIFEPRELQYIELRHEQQLGDHGTKLIFDANYVKTRPGSSLEDLDIDGQSTTFDVALTHPLIRSRQTNWFINSDFSAQRVNLSSFDSNLYQDNLRVLRVGSSYDFVDSIDAINRIEGNISKGFGWGTDNDGLAHSRLGANASFWKVAAQANRIQPIYGPFQAQLSATGQYSADPLYVAEEFALGGPAFGSAYDPAELTGDSGLAGRLELQYNGAYIETFLPAYQLYGFYDIGIAWNRNVIAASEFDHASLASAGFGARFNLVEALSGGFELAVPLTKKVSAFGEDGSAPRAFFNLQYRY